MADSKQLRLYLDTTIPSYVFAQDSPERMEITKRFMQLRFSPRYQMVISEVVLWELGAASDDKKVLLMEQVDGLRVLPMSAIANQLAKEYLQDGVLPLSSIDDARHVALATLHHLDAIVSWNFGHLVNIRRSKGFNDVNERLGLPLIEIVTPEEVL